jgi:hypothetical protein
MKCGKSSLDAHLPCTPEAAPQEAGPCEHYDNEGWRAPDMIVSEDPPPCTRCEQSYYLHSFDARQAFNLRKQIAELKEAVAHNRQMAADYGSQLATLTQERDAARSEARTFAESYRISFEAQCAAQARVRGLEGAAKDGRIIQKAAEAIANARVMRRGSPPISNVWAILPQKLRDEVTEVATAALTAALSAKDADTKL